MAPRARPPRACPSCPFTPRDASLVMAFIARLLPLSRGRYELEPSAEERAALRTVVHLAEAHRLALPIPPAGLPIVAPAVDDEETWLSTEEAAQKVGLSARAIRAAIAKDVLPARPAAGRKGSEVTERELTVWASQRRKAA